MKKLVLLWAVVFLGLWAMAKAEDPKIPMPSTPDQVWENDREIYNFINRTLSRPLPIANMTATNINSSTPSAAGLIVFCSDCSTIPICVSTQAAIKGYASISSKATPCQ